MNAPVSQMHRCFAPVPVSELLAALNDPDWPVRLAAIVALGARRQMRNGVRKPRRARRWAVCENRTRNLLRGHPAGFSIGVRLLVFFQRRHDDLGAVGVSPMHGLAVMAERLPGEPLGVISGLG